MIRVTYSGVGDVPGFDNTYRDANEIKSAPFAKPPFGMPSVDTFYTEGLHNRPHSSLPGLFWDDSGHMGTPNRIAAFTSEGYPVCIPYPEQRRRELPDLPSVRSVLVYDPEEGLGWAPVVPFTCPIPE